MTAHYLMKLNVSSGSYVIITVGGSSLVLPVGDKPVRIDKRWRLLHDSNIALSDAYLEGVVGGIKHELTLE